MAMKFKLGRTGLNFPAIRKNSEWVIFVTHSIYKNLSPEAKEVIDTLEPMILPVTEESVNAKGESGIYYIVTPYIECD